MEVDANGTRLHVEITGDGPPLLCLHSLATDTRVWDRQLDDLTDRFRVIRVDLRGHGSSPATAPPYSLDLLREDVVAVMDALDIESADVMGLSIGAILALGLALDNPVRVDRIVVADCRADAPPPYVAMWDDAIATIETQGLAPVIETSVARWFSEQFRSDRPDVVEEIRNRAMGTSIEGFIGCARAVQGLAYLDRLHHIETPALLVVGELDPAAPPAVMADMASRIPGAELVQLAGAGHLSPVEAPQLFNDAVLPFLTWR